MLLSVIAGVTSTVSVAPQREPVSKTLQAMSVTLALVTAYEEDGTCNHGVKLGWVNGIHFVEANPSADGLCYSSCSSPLSWSCSQEALQKS